MSEKTKILSVRVPIDVALMVENTCKQRGISKNVMLQECIASEGIVGVNSFKNGGDIASVEPVPEIVSSILIGIGSVATGSCVYHLLKNNLPKTWDEDTIEFVSMLSAIASGFGMAYGLNKVIKK